MTKLIQQFSLAASLAATMGVVTMQTRIASVMTDFLPRWTFSNARLFIFGLTAVLIAYVLLCLVTRTIVRKYLMPGKMTAEVRLMCWLQSGVRAMNEIGEQPIVVRVANVCRYLVTDEAVFIGTPLLVWTFQERIMFLPFALNVNELMNGLMKWCVQRPRPYWIETTILNPIKKQETDFSFPSSHAQVSASLATALLTEFGANMVTVPIVLLMLLVCFSRVILGVHYPTDVLAGAGLGVLITNGLHKSGFLDWFIEDLLWQDQVLSLVTVMVIVPLAFESIRLSFPEDKSLLTLYSKGISTSRRRSSVLGLIKTYSKSTSGLSNSPEKESKFRGLDTSGSRRRSSATSVTRRSSGMEKGTIGDAEMDEKEAMDLDLIKFHSMYGSSSALETGSQNTHTTRRRSSVSRTMSVSRTSSASSEHDGVDEKEDAHDLIKFRTIFESSKASDQCTSGIHSGSTPRFNRRSSGIEKAATVDEVATIVRHIGKYNFVFLSLFGSGLGCVFMVRDNRAYALQFPIHAVSFKEIAESNFLWRRVLLLGFPVMMLLFAFTFVAPKKLAATKHRRLGALARLIGPLLLGLWITYGCPKSAWLLNWEDPLLTCPPKASRTDEHFLASSVDYNWQRHANECDLSPFNHTAASPRAQVVSEEISTIEQLQAKIKATRDAGKVLRVVGAGWSTKSLFQQDDITLYVSLVGEKFQDYRKVDVESAAEDEKPLVVAGAGIFLGGQQWSIDSLNVEWENSLVHKLWMDGLALPSIPDAIGMTLGGVLSTGTDGWAFDTSSPSDPFQPSDSFSSSVLGFRYIDGTGELREAWRNSTDIDFKAFGVSMGLAGVLYEVILQPVSAYCVELSFNRANTGLCTSEAVRGQWRAYMRTGMSAYDSVDVLEKRIVDPSAVTETGELLCGDKSPLGSTPFYDESNIPTLLFKHSTSTAQINFISEILALTLRWLEQESCHNVDDLCQDDRIRKYLEERASSLPAALDESHFMAFESCARSLVVQKRRKASGERPEWQNEWWNKEMLRECYGKVLSTFGSGEQEKGVHGYYETAFLHRGITFHPLHVMEVYFPLDCNGQTAEEILCHLQNIYDEEGHDGVGQNADFYFSNANNDFWMPPESSSLLLTTPNATTISDKKGEVLRVNLYVIWANDDFDSVYERFLDRFDAIGLTYRLHWGKIIPKRPDLMSRILRSYPNYANWLAFVHKRDPHGVFLSDYWRSVFQGLNGSEL